MKTTKESNCIYFTDREGLKAVPKAWVTGNLDDWLFENPGRPILLQAKKEGIAGK